MPRTVRVRVAAIDGRCEVHEVGDVFYIRGAKLDAKGYSAVADGSLTQQRLEPIKIP